MPEKNLNSQIKEMLVASLMLKLPASEIGDDTLLFSPDGLALDSIETGAWSKLNLTDGVLTTVSPAESDAVK